MDQTQLQLLLIAAIIVILLLLFILLLPYIRRQRSKTPDSTLKLRKVPHPFEFRESPNAELNSLIVTAVNQMGGFGPNAEADYQSALDALRRQEAAALSIIVAEYKALPESRYLDRWSLVQLLAELKNPDSLPALDDVLSSSVPPEQSKNPHSFSTLGQEIMIRTTAVEAATRIAAAGGHQAVDLLLKHARHNIFSVRRACIQGYLAHGGNEAKERLLKIVPENERFIMEIRREDVRNVPQPKGQNFLRRPERDLPPRIPVRK